MHMQLSLVQGLRLMITAVPDSKNIFCSHFVNTETHENTYNCSLCSSCKREFG